MLKNEEEKIKYRKYNLKKYNVMYIFCIISMHFSIIEKILARETI